MKHTRTRSFRSRNRIMFTESSGRTDSVAMILSLLAVLPLAALCAADTPKATQQYTEFGWKNDLIVNLFGRNGLPVGPFRTDSFDLVNTDSEE